MKTLFLAAFAALVLETTTSLAAERPSCAVPGYLLSSDSQLKRVGRAVNTRHQLDLAVVGTGSSALAGPDGPRSPSPARLEAVPGHRPSRAPVEGRPLVSTRQ